MERLKKIFLKLWPTRIWQQIFVILIILAVVPLAILGMMLIHTSQKAIKTAVMNDYKEIAVRSASEVNEVIQKPRELLEITASLLGVLNTDYWRQETVLVELALKHPEFRWVASVNLEGKEVVTSVLGTPLQDRSQEEGFDNARHEEIYISEAEIQENRAPIVTMAVPIRRLGSVRGVLMAKVNLRGIWDIVDSIQVGKTGHACVIDRAGIVISHPDKKMVMGNEKSPYLQIIEKGCEGRVCSGEIVDEYGERWLVSSAPIKENNWSLVIFQPAEEAYVSSRIMRIQSRILIFLSIVAALLISIGLARFMSRPIHDLLKGTQRVAQGDLDYAIEISRKDELGQLLSSFNDMVAKLKKAHHLEKLSVIGSAAAAIAHELKNSLVLVNTYIHVLPERYKDKDFITEFSRIVPQELDAWKGKLQEITEFSRLHSFALEEIDVNSVINDVSVLAQAWVKQHGINFHVHMLDSLPLIRGNKEKLKQVLLNLISNALEATAPGRFIRMSSGLTRASDKDASYIVIQIDDEGEGIAKEQLEKIFEPFYSTKEGGLGLGLPISKEIVERHGGYVEVLSQKGKGTSFKVWIPVAQEKFS